MFLKTIVVVNLILITTIARDDEYSRLYQLELVSLKNPPGKSYTYDISRVPGCTPTEIKYLGIIKTQSCKQYKILNSFFVYSTSNKLSCRAEGMIKIYNMKNKFVGLYFVHNYENMPDKLYKNCLVYLKRKSKNFVRNKTTYISFSKGIPKTIFVPEGVYIPEGIVGGEPFEFN